jgi:hypothetical protein
MFTPPADSIIFETAYWRVHHNTDARLQGYLIIGTLEQGGFEFSN